MIWGDGFFQQKQGTLTKLTVLFHSTISQLQGQIQTLTHKIFLNARKLEAMDALRKQLDVLMGANRNGDAQEVTRKYFDREVCRLFLAGLCPHELFQLTVSIDFDLLFF